MTKAEFLNELKSRLRGLPDEDVSDRLDFYSEMIDDRMEDGENEEESVASLGSIDEVVSKIFAETPLPRIVKKKVKNKHPSGCIAALIILGIPAWLPLLIAILSIVLAIYITMWAAVLTVVVIAAALLASTLGLLFAGTIFLFTGKTVQGLFIIGSVMICAGLSLLTIILVRLTVKGVIFMGKRLWFGIKYFIAGMR